MSTASVREDSRYEASKWDCKDQRTDGSFCAKVESELARADVPKIHVLAVDDSLLERKVIERLLKNSSYEVTTVDSASRALEILGVVDGMSPLVPHAMKINLIITDYCMPGMSGYDLLKRVKQTSGLQEIPVVIMSSENVPNRVKRCLAEGAKEFIIKPVQMADLKRLECHVRKKIFSLNNSESKPSEKLDNSNGTPSMPSKKHQTKRISTDNITFLENSSKRKNVPADLHTQQTSGRRLRLKRTDIGSKPMLEP